jgi:hypothetical protein
MTVCKRFILEIVSANFFRGPNKLTFRMPALFLALHLIDGAKSQNELFAVDAIWVQQAVLVLRMHAADKHETTVS